MPEVELDAATIGDQDTGSDPKVMAAAEGLRGFDRPMLVVWAAEDRLMPLEHGRRLAQILPQGRLVG